MTFIYRLYVHMHKVINTTMNSHEQHPNEHIYVFNWQNSERGPKSRFRCFMSGVWKMISIHKHAVMKAFANLCEFMWTLVI